MKKLKNWGLGIGDWGLGIAHFQGTHDSLVELYLGALRFFSEHSLRLPNNALKVQHHFA